MRIATFGSCLSLRIADQFRALHGGELISCVYHNRSDQFLSRFVERTIDDLPYEDVRAATEIATGSEEDAILRNQCSRYMGSHLLRSWTPFLDALNEEKIDLLLVDNFMDASAALRSLGDVSFFSRLKPTELNRLRVLPKLPADRSADNFSALLAHFRSKLPDATIVFTAFPWNTYPGAEGSQRKAWEELFSSRLVAETAIRIPTKLVPQELQGEVPSHYKREMYQSYVPDVVRAVTRRNQPEQSSPHPTFTQYLY